MNHLTIGGVARHAGLRTSAIRYYERIGLLPEAERVSGQRRYDDDILKRLAVIRMAQEAGFTIDDIRTLLNGFPENTSAATRWQELAQRKLQEVDALIHRMQTIREVLEESVTCNCLTLDACATYGWRVEEDSDDATN